MVIGLNLLRGRHLANAVTSAASMGFLLFGYDQGVLSGLLLSDRFNNQFQLMATVNGQQIQNAAKVANIVSIYEMGCLFGAAFILFTGEALGRRRSMLVGTSILIVGAALQASAFGVPQIVVGRIIAGFGNGMNSATIPVYNSEVSRTKNRGRDLAIGQAMLIAGLALSYWFDYGLSFINSDANWRLPIAFQTVFAVSLILMLIDLPESPRWLLARGRVSDARTVLAHLESDSAKPTDAIVVAQSREIEEAIELERSVSGDFSYKELFEGGEMQNFRRLCLCFGIQLMQQMGGINLISYYLTLVFKSMGLSDNMSRLLSGFNGLAYFVSALIPVLYIERLGRRRSMMTCAVGCSASMAILGILLAVNPAGTGIQGRAAVAMMFTFNTFFSIGWLAIPWLYPAEICTLRLRSKGSATATISNWLFNFTIVQVTPVAIQNLGWKTYIMFAIFNASFIPMVYFFYPETALKPLESIDTIFSSPDKYKIGTGEDVFSRDQPQLEGSAGDFEEKAGDDRSGVLA
ncbi:general substrate transporter [Gautieria morchelliformis]|nr:general substrate transporter [Gautieria morchelliformis]